MVEFKKNYLTPSRLFLISNRVTIIASRLDHQTYLDSQGNVRQFFLGIDWIWNCRAHNVEMIFMGEGVGRRQSIGFSLLFGAWKPKPIDLDVLGYDVFFSDFEWGIGKWIINFFHELGVRTIQHVNCLGVNNLPVSSVHPKVDSTCDIGEFLWNRRRRVRWTLDIRRVYFGQNLSRKIFHAPLKESELNDTLMAMPGAGGVGCVSPWMRFW